MFRQAFAKRRCLVPADAFYEWKVEEGGKQPVAIAPATGEGIALAGIWKHWRGESDEIVRTFAIITTDANAHVPPLRSARSHGCRLPAGR